MGWNAHFETDAGNVADCPAFSRKCSGDIFIGIGISEMTKWIREGKVRAFLYLYIWMEAGYGQRVVRGY